MIMEPTSSHKIDLRVAKVVYLGYLVDGLVAVVRIMIETTKENMKVYVDLLAVVIYLIIFC
jgi:hypothetical protein